MKTYSANYLSFTVINAVGFSPEEKHFFWLLNCGMQKHVTSTATVEDINWYGNQFTVVYDELDTSRTTWKMF